MDAKRCFNFGCNVVAAFGLVAAGNVAVAQSAGFADGVLGRWDLTVASEDGSYPSWINVHLRKETELMAEFVGRFGSMRHASAVSYEDGQLVVRVPVQYEAGNDDLVFTGTLQDGRLTGQVRMGDGSLLNWRGERAPLLDRGEISNWAAPISMIGKDLSGWRLRDDALAGCWTVDDGVLRAAPPCTDLISNVLFDDFRLQLEFRYPPGSNSGVYLRGRYEVQIQDDHGKALDPLRMGGVYGFVTPATDASRPAGEWQRYEITLTGRRVTVSLNGTEIISNREIPGITGGALDSDEGASGPLMLQGDHGPIEYRNIVITPGT